VLGVQLSVSVDQQAEFLDEGEEPEEPKKVTCVLCTLIPGKVSPATVFSFFLPSTPDTPILTLTTYLRDDALNIC
jgi:hypothetical protein